MGCPETPAPIQTQSISSQHNANVKCDICGQMITVKSLSRHKMRFHSDHLKTCKCPYCGKMVQEKSLYRHSLICKRRNGPVAKQTYKCSRCPRTFTGHALFCLHSWRSHKVNETGKELVTCEYCGKTTITSLVASHMRSCTAVPGNETWCSICSKTIKKGMLHVFNCRPKSNIYLVLDHKL